MKKISPDFLQSIGFEWNARLGKYTKRYHFGTLYIGKSDIVWVGSLRLGRYSTQEGLEKLVDALSLASDK